MALSLLSLLCSVNEHYILLIIHRLRSRVYTLQVNNAKKSNLFAYLIATQQLIGFSIVVVDLLLGLLRPHHYVINKA